MEPQNLKSFLGQWVAIDFLSSGKQVCYFGRLASVSDKSLILENDRFGPAALSLAQVVSVRENRGGRP